MTENNLQILPKKLFWNKSLTNEKWIIFLSQCCHSEIAQHSKLITPFQHPAMSTDSPWFELSYSIQPKVIFYRLIFFILFASLTAGQTAQVSVPLFSVFVRWFY